jgi:ATP-dependent Clp protease protease subunit
LLSSMEKNFKAKLIACTGKSEKDVSEWFDGTDYWFDADECVTLGLATDKFSPKTSNIVTLDKSEAMQIGAQAVYNRFVASLTNPNIPNSNNSEMKTEDLIKRYGLTTVTAQSTEEEVLAAVDAKVNAGATAMAEAQKSVRKAIETSVDGAVVAGKITAANRDQYIARGEKLGLEELNAVLADMKVYQPVTAQLHGKGGETPKAEREGWTWKDYQTKAVAELEAMPKADPEKFKALYKAEYGTEPEL